jgi:hypothetical protein
MSVEGTLLKGMRLGKERPHASFQVKLSNLCVGFPKLREAKRESEFT